MRKPKGYFKIAEFGDIPLYVHWSVPLGGIFFAWMGHIDPKLWLYYVITITCLLVIHEFGHAIAARLVGLKIHSVEIFGFGGVCRIDKPRRLSHAFLVYSAGLIAQFVLLLVTQVYLSIRGKPNGDFESAAVYTFTTVNIIMFFMNLIPVKLTRNWATDGRVLWNLLVLAIRG